MHSAASARAGNRPTGPRDFAMTENGFRRTQAHAQHLRRFVHVGLWRFRGLVFVLPIHVEFLSFTHAVFLCNRRRR